MGRPAGDIRNALRDAALGDGAGQGLVTWRTLAAAGLVGWRAARWAVQRMEASGELERVGVVPTGGRGRPAVAYRPVRVCALPDLAHRLSLLQQLQ